MSKNTSTQTSISIIIPVCNEEGSIGNLWDEINGVCTEQGYDFEVIFVDDGSTDKTRSILKKICSAQAEKTAAATTGTVKYIRMRRNFGQTAAMDAGIKASTKKYIVTMDGDGQNDPADIPRLIEHLEDYHLDVVSGWRKNRKDKLLKRLSSRMANVLRSMIVHDNIHDSGCSLKIYRRECFNNLNLYGEMHRFIPGLLKIKGFSIGEIIVNHRPRTQGRTKYNWKRGIKGILDMITVWFWHKYAVRPFHLLGGFGIISLFIGGFFGIWTVLLFVQGSNLSDHLQPVMAVWFIIIGILMFVFGLMSDMMTRIYFGSKIDMPYSIKEIVDSKDKSAIG